MERDKAEEDLEGLRTGKEEEEEHNEQRASLLPPKLIIRAL